MGMTITGRRYKVIRMKQLEGDGDDNVNTIDHEDGINWTCVIATMCNCTQHFLAYPLRLHTKWFTTLPARVQLFLPSPLNPGRHAQL